MSFRRIGIIVVLLLSVTLLLFACSDRNGDKQQSLNTNDPTEPTVQLSDEAEEVDSLQRVRNAGEITVAGSGGYPPFNFIDENGDVIGFDVDVGKVIAERLGVKLNYVTGDFSGLTEGLRSKRFDGILGSMAITEERLKTVDFTIPYYYSGAQLIVRNDSGFTAPSEMEGKKIGVATGTNFAQDAEELNAEVMFYDDDNLTLMELVSGRLDGVITDRLVALKAMNELKGGDELILCGEILRLEEMAIAVNKDDTDLLDKINEILQEMHDDGTMASISEQWHNGADITKK